MKVGYPISKSEQRATALMQRVLGKRRAETMQRRGYITFTSGTFRYQIYAQKRARIRRQRARTRRQGGELCVLVANETWDKPNLPWQDDVVWKYLLCRHHPELRKRIAKKVVGAGGNRW